MRRKIWIAVFLALTGTALGMEVWAGAVAPAADRPAWTDLIVTYFPAEVTVGAVGLLTTWLGPHFLRAYQLRTQQAATRPKWWLAADGANRAWRTILQGAVATVLASVGDAVLQSIQGQLAAGGGIDWAQVAHTAEATGSTALLIAVLAYLHRTVVDPSALPSGQPPADQSNINATAKRPVPPDPAQPVR